jgi:hypothetical protein
MYAKWRIFVYQVATFAGVGVREGLGHRDGAKRRAVVETGLLGRCHARDRLRARERAGALQRNPSPFPSSLEEVRLL